MSTNASLHARRRRKCLPKRCSALLGPPSVVSSDETSPGNDVEDKENSMTYPQTRTSDEKKLRLLAHERTSPGMQNHLTSSTSSLCSNTEHPPLQSLSNSRESHNWISMRDRWGVKRYRVIEVLGRGGSSEVLKVVGSDGAGPYALKVVTLDSADSNVARGYVNEIKLLKKLHGADHVVTLFDYSWDQDKGKLLLLLEYGSTDLNKILSLQGQSLSTKLIKTYWKHMLLAVKAIQSENIIHRDLKPANFVLVGDVLKLIDFGISSSVASSDVTSILPTERCGTISYMAPEALHYDQGQGFKVGRYSDIWSLSCILYLMVYGHTPFHDIKDTIPRMMAIIDPNHEIRFSAITGGLGPAVDILRKCLVRDPKIRPTIDELLLHPFICND